MKSLGVLVCLIFAANAVAQSRTWTFGASGKSEGGAMSYRKGGRIDAEFSDFLGTNVVMLKLNFDGKEYPINISALSAGDREFLIKLRGKPKLAARALAIEMSGPSQAKAEPAPTVARAPAENPGLKAKETDGSGGVEEWRIKSIMSKLSGYEELSGPPQRSMNHKRAFVFGRPGHVGPSARPGALTFGVSRHGGGQVPCIAYKDHDTEVDSDGVVFGHTAIADEVESLPNREEVAFVGHVVVLRDSKTSLGQARGGIFFSVEEVMKP